MLGLDTMALPCIVCSDARDCDWEGNCLETVLDEVWIWYSGLRATGVPSWDFVMGKMEIGKGQGVIPKHCGKQKWRGSGLSSEVL